MLSAKCPFHTVNWTNLVYMLNSKDNKHDTAMSKNSTCAPSYKYSILIVND